MAVEPMNAPSLPDKLSDCLEVALADLERVEIDPRYVIDMGWFHTPIDGKCRTCLAGAAMAGLGVPAEHHITTTSFDRHNSVRLRAISNVAIESVLSGLLEMNVLVPASIRDPNWRTPHYKFGAEAFKQYIRSAITALRNEGL